MTVPTSERRRSLWAPVGGPPGRAELGRAAMVTAAVAVLSALTSLLLPSWYSTGASFTVDATPSPGLGGSGVLGLASQFGLANALTGGSGSAQYYADVLSSPSVTDRVALGGVPHSAAGDVRNDFGAQEGKYLPRARDTARRRFAKHFGVSVNARTSTITFRVEGRTPFAAKAAGDTLLSRLNSVIIDLRRRRASSERAFIERRLDSAAVRQAALEDTLRYFYTVNRITSGSPTLQFAETRLKRRVDFALDLSNQLRVQLEQAKLQEVRDTPVISVISGPELPGRRSSPNRRLIVLAGVLFGAALAAADFVRARRFRRV